MKSGGLGRFFKYLADPKCSEIVVVVAGVSRLIVRATMSSGVGSITISALT
jgi:hypothetical protein